MVCHIHHSRRYFADSFDTGPGRRQIAYIEGEEVMDGVGDDIKTVLLSHVQIINVDACSLHSARRVRSKIERMYLKRLLSSLLAVQRL